MCTEVFKTDTIDEAAEQILKALKEHRNTTRTVSTRSNVIYFDGWDGLGASAVLRAVAERVTTTSPAGQSASPAGLEFDQVMQIDCSLSESRRALQRAVAEQLKLPDEVMRLFDRQDEKDDFAGLAQGSRAELQEVVREMYQHMQNRSILVIFHNGSSEEIDMSTCCGFPLSGYSTSMVMWTFQGRFRMKPRDKVDTAMKRVGATDTFISMAKNHQTEEQVWSCLVLEEAVEVVEACNETHGIMVRPAQVAECFLYMLELCCRGSHSIDYDLATHGANYWVCDSIIHHHQLQEGERDLWGSDGNTHGMWRASHALQREMPLDMDHHQYLSSPHLPRFIKSKPYWSSPTCGFNRISDGLIHNGDMFQQHSFGKQLISVVKLSSCTFDFESPPFLCCHGLRFLWLDHCQGTSSAGTAGAGKEDICRFFQGLWVLDVRYSDCDLVLSTQKLDLMTQLQELIVMGAKDLDMGLLQGRLPNIRKLRVTKSSICCSSPGNRICLEMDKMELLEFSGNDTWYHIESMRLYELGISSSSNTCLETAILEECEGMRMRMFFRGCTKLKNLVFRGRMFVKNLDISGTAVKMLDFSAITAWGLYDELCLLKCDKLCAILWPPWLGRHEEKFKLLIDTTQSASSVHYRKDGQGGSIAATQTGVAASHEHGNRSTIEFGWHISVRDARLLFSLESVYGSSRVAYVEVSSPAPPTVTTGFIKGEATKCGNNNEHQVVAHLQRQAAAPAVYADTTVAHLHQQAKEGEGDAPVVMCMWPCPDPPSLPKNRCYMHIQEPNCTTVPKYATIIVPSFVTRSAKILHMHDSMCVNVTFYQEWTHIEWCKIERCPKLKSVFRNKIGDTDTDTDTHHWHLVGDSYSLEIFWASQLLKACYICRWNWNDASSSEYFRCFRDLRLLHLDLCPRLIHAFPVFKEGSFDRLETIEILWCGELREVFPLGTKSEPYCETLGFPALKHIHLHELPSLHSICWVQMSTPNLETVKIRGCWSLTSLPDVSSSNRVVECDCEKEWWDRLEWDNSSQADHYKPIHPRYYKKTLLRGSVLR